VAATTAIRRAADETRDRVARARLLPAYVEIMLAASDVGAARAAVGEMASIADEFDAPLLRAATAHVTGAVLLAEGDPRAALVPLRQAWTAWQRIEAPYEGARARVLIALACRGLGDEDAAELELGGARWVFERLGAAPDVARVQGLTGQRKGAAKAASGLTAREVEVLRLVAAGHTNQKIAATLAISAHTVRRHLQNIFDKIGVSSRAAATAFAFQHGLI
jgi:DNA-binding CsgD family transcriptional regulator